MEICLVRHAIAVERGTAGYDDDRARPLTRQGRERMREAAAGLKRLLEPEVILTSPVLRARQTAEILSDAFKAPIRECDGLGTGDHERVLQALGATKESRVVLVGHEPWMSELLAVLVSGGADGIAAEFKKGAAAFVSCAGAPRPGSCLLQWLMQPAALRRMA